MGVDKASEPLASPKGDGLMSPPSPLGLSAGRPVYKPLTIQCDDDEDNDEDNGEDNSPEDYDEDGGTCGGFGQDFPERTSIDFGEDGRVESSPGKGPSYGDGGMGSPRLPDRCGNPITNNQMFTVDNSQPSSYTARFVPVGGRGLQNECRGAELGLLSLSPPRLYYNQQQQTSAAGAAQTTTPFLNDNNKHKVK